MVSGMARHDKTHRLGFFVKFFLGHHNWQPINQRFMLRVTRDLIGKFGKTSKQKLKNLKQNVL